jgi:hypothetical protein
MTDVPTLTNATTANYATLNPLVNVPSFNFTTLSNGNLTSIGNSATNNGVNFSTQTVKTGKWYAEFTCTGSSGSYPMVGITDPTQLGSTGGTPGYGSNGVGYIASGLKTVNNAQTSYGDSFTTNDVIGIAVDADNGAVYFSKNGTFQNSGVPTSGSSKTGAAYTYTGGTIEFYLSVSAYQSGTGFHANFGQRPFSYTPPTGFVALNTFNLPEPSIKAGNKHFDAVTRNGFGSSGGSVTSLNFQPDFWWEKARSTASNHTLIDSIRGVTKELYSNLTNAESTGSNFLTSFNSNGFTMGSNDWGTGTTVVDWAWKANGTGVTNTAGSITSTVSANPSAGFSVVTWTGTGSTASIGHGLGATPTFIIVKCRANTNSWRVYVSGITGNADSLILNSTAALQTGNPNAPWSTSNMTSTTFGVGVNTDTNQSAQAFVAYCFAPVAGYSAFGSYTGNGSTDGTFVYTGFRPKFVMIKRTDTGGTDWVLLDSSRDPTNVVDQYLAANLSDAEGVYANDKVDFLSNGFKQRGTASGQNGSGGTFIYMAFAENPFRNSLAR